MAKLERNDAGGGFSWCFYYADDKDDPVGIFEWHDCSGHQGDGPSSVPFDVPANAHIENRHKWQVESLDPITISPSILCNLCGFHGFLREGRWVSA
jgi:hypothetical protein